MREVEGGGGGRGGRGRRGREGGRRVREVEGGGGGRGGRGRRGREGEGGDIHVARSSHHRPTEEGSCAY